MVEKKISLILIFVILHGDYLKPLPLVKEDGNDDANDEDNS